MLVILLDVLVEQIEPFAEVFHGVFLMYAPLLEDVTSIGQL